MSDMKIEKLQITPIDNNAVLNGSEFNYRGVKMKIARAQNTQFIKLFKELSKDQKVEGKSSSEIAEGYEETTMQTMAKTVVIDWVPFHVKSGGENVLVEYSPENAYNLLKNDSDAREAISGFANNINNFLTKESNILLGES